MVNNIIDTYIKIRIKLIENPKISLNIMKFFFLFYIILLPLGRAPREICTAGCIFFLFLYYLTGYSESNLNKYRFKYIASAFILYILFNASITSIDCSESLKTSAMGVFKGTVFLFAGMEFVRSAKDIKLLIVTFALTGFYEGLDGVYQYIHGYDFIRNTQPWGQRLTGSLITPRVGNLMSLLIPVSMAIYFILKKHFNTVTRLLITATVLTPQIFLLYGSQTRSGQFGLFASLVALIFINTNISKIKVTAATLIAFAALTLAPGRLNFENILNDARMELWLTAGKIFTHYPFFGSGFNTYETAYDSLGIAHTQSVNMPHPHNIYMQFLAEGGIIGFALLIIFLFGHLLWSYYAIRKLLLEDKRLYIIATFFWASYVGYLATAISAHSFFRLWWLGMGMAVLGIVTGCCLMQNGRDSANLKTSDQ